MPKNKSLTDRGTVPPAMSSDGDIAAFVSEARRKAPPPTGERGRLIFALDATMSRQPTWDRACQLQAEMFRETTSIGGLDVKLVYFRGFNECRASGWVDNPAKLTDLMTRIDCRGGHTQIRKVLAQTRKDAQRDRVSALVYVGDAMEEGIDDLCAIAGELGILKVPAFLFQEGHDPIAERAFREIARLTGGAWCRFDPNAPGQLRELLSAVAVYAAGGRRALEHRGRSSTESRLLLEQLSGK
ncbi:MAG: VWA domain-containing protein [Pseudomonadota bacterium]